MITITLPPMSTKINIPQKLKKAVVAEALLLRKHATKEEINRLRLDTINGFNSNSCIYGQMTATSCNSERAVELLNRCANPFSSSNIVVRPKIDYSNFDDRIGYANVYSAIEVYICQPGAKISDLIGLIKS